MTELTPAEQQAVRAAFYEAARAVSDEFNKEGGVSPAHDSQKGSYIFTKKGHKLEILVRPEVGDVRVTTNPPERRSFPHAEELIYSIHSISADLCEITLGAPVNIKPPYVTVEEFLRLFVEQLDQQT